MHCGIQRWTCDFDVSMLGYRQCGVNSDPNRTRGSSSPVCSAGWRHINGDSYFPCQKTRTTCGFLLVIISWDSGSWTGLFTLALAPTKSTVKVILSRRNCLSYGCHSAHIHSWRFDYPRLLTRLADGFSVLCSFALADTVRTVYGRETNSHWLIISIGIGHATLCPRR